MVECWAIEDIGNSIYPSMPDGIIPWEHPTQLSALSLVLDIILSKCHWLLFLSFF
jgi:hypothetical protein